MSFLSRARRRRTRLAGARTAFTWTSVFGPATNRDFTGIAGKGDTWVMTGPENPAAENSMWYSLDNGATWTQFTDLAMNNRGWGNVIFANGLFVACASTGTNPKGIAYISEADVIAETDLWTFVAFGGTGNPSLEDIDYDFQNERFCAIGDTGATDQKGAHQTLALIDTPWLSVDNNENRFGIAYLPTGDKFITVHANATDAEESTDGGATFAATAGAMPSDPNWRAVAASLTKVVAVAFGTGSAKPHITHSSDGGATWDFDPTFFTEDFYAITTGDGLFVAVGNSISIAAFVTTLNFFAFPIPSINWRAIGYNGAGRFIATAQRAGAGGDLNRIAFADV